MEIKRTIKLLFPIALMVMALTLTTINSYAATTNNATATINAKSGAVLRAKASTLSKQKAILSDNAEIIIVKEVFTSKTSTKKTNKWYYVKQGSLKGYVRSDLVHNIQYSAVSAKTTANLNYRVGPGTKMSIKGTLKKGKTVSVYLKASPVSSTKGDNSTWYKIKVGKYYRYVCSSYVQLVETNADASDEDANKEDSKDEPSNNDDEAEKKEEQQDEFDAYLNSQGFPETYQTKLKELHKLHPNWVFIAYNTNISWDAAVKAESRTGYCVVHKSQPIAYRSKDTGDYDSSNESWKSKTWYTANSQTVSYYLDPRNFLTSDRAYMFEQLSYNGDYQTESIVDQILTTKLKKCGFTADLFEDAGKTHNISPIHIASRATSENGSGSTMIDGSGKYNDTVVYNPFNIGAADSNPINGGLKTAYNNGWFTPALAVSGGAQYIAKNYINCKQDTVYFQKFNVANGIKYLATHQYMTNLLAPYNEAGTTKSAYSKYGITEKSLSFIIPIYSDMPESTSLPS